MIYNYIIFTTTHTHTCTHARTHACTHRLTRARAYPAIKERHYCLEMFLYADILSFLPFAYFFVTYKKYMTICIAVFVCLTGWIFIDWHWSLCRFHFPVIKAIQIGLSCLFHSAITGPLLSCNHLCHCAITGPLLSCYHLCHCALIDFTQCAVSVLFHCDYWSTLIAFFSLFFFFNILSWSQ